MPYPPIVLKHFRPVFDLCFPLAVVGWLLSIGDLFGDTIRKWVNK